MFDLITPKELAAHWCVPVHRLYPLLRSGVVPAIKIDGSWFVILFNPPDDLD